MPILGAHQSIAGGYERAISRAQQGGCDCVQLFTHNSNQWRMRPILPEEAQRFRDTLGQSQITHTLAHQSYLINLASPDPQLWRKSIDSFVQELLRAQSLGIPYVVAHPGAYTVSSEAEGIGRVAVALDEAFRQTPGSPVGCLLETTAGQGTCIGCRFEHLAEIRSQVGDPQRVAVCFDTCHVFASGYPLSPRRRYATTMRQFDGTVGLDAIRAFHLNDSRGAFGSRVDRHEHIGRGQLGLDAFRLLLSDRRFKNVPMYLETPKGQSGKTDWDTVNLRVLRSLADGEL